MTPLPAALKGNELIVWRLDRSIYFPDWEHAEGSFRVGGRWSSAGKRILYTSMDPSTTMVEVAVHKGFNALDRVPHTLFSIAILDPSKVHVVEPTDARIANPNWLRPGSISSNQQAFGDALLDAHPMVAFPSVVSPHSWNLLINMSTAAGLYTLRHSEPFALDTRLTPVGPG